MADKYALTGLWSNANSWSLSDGGAAGAGKPGAGDTAIFTSNSGAMVLDENATGFATLTMTGYANTLSDDGNAWVIDPGGAAILDGTINLATPGSGISVPDDIILTAGMTFTAGQLIQDGGDSKTLTTNDVVIPSFRLSNASSLPLIDFNSTNGVDVATHIIIDAGSTMTSTREWTQTGSGNLLNPTSSNRFFALNIACGAGHTATLTGHVITKKLTHGAGTVTGAFNLTIQPAANDFWITNGIPAGFNVTTLFANIITSNWSNANPVNVLAQSLDINAYTNNLTWTQSENLTCGNLNVRGTAGVTGKLTLTGGASLNAAAITLGWNGGAGRPGVLTFSSGIHKITSIAKAHALAVDNAVAFASAYIETTGLINLTDIAPTNVACHIECGAAGSVDNMPAAGLTEKVHVYGDATADGGSNSAANIDFNAHAPPGSLVLTGAGI